MPVKGLGEECLQPNTFLYHDRYAVMLCACIFMSLIHSVHVVGITFYYVVLQLLLWWLWHTIAVFWAVTWPFHARKFNTSRNTKYLHIAFALASLVLPVGPVLVILFVSSTPGRERGGFTITRSPPFFCTGFDVHINFWAYIFPVTLILATGVAFLILILRIIIKVRCS